MHPQLKLILPAGPCAVSHDREQDLANAAALGNALLAFLVVPWTLTLLLYTGGGAASGCTPAAVCLGAVAESLRHDTPGRLAG
jgi:hypothetical protein